VLTSDILRTEDDLCRIKDEWSGLALQQPATTVFQQPEWLLTWWKHFGSGEVRAWSFRENGLAGLLPCFLHHWQESRQLTLLGTGVSDYLEPVIVPDRANEASELIARDLDRAHDWDICVWQDLNEPTALAAISRNSRLKVEVQDDTPCSRIAIEASFERYWEARPHGLRRNVRRYLNRAREIDNPRFSVSCTADAEALTSLIDLHTARWGRQRESGMVAANRSATFLREISAQFATRGLVRLFTLRFQEKIVSVILGFAYQNTIYAYLSGFDPEYEALGFGRILLFEAIRYSFENGFRSWDFLRGAEPYKSEWGARPIRKQRLVIRRA
jgi:CelD/BcsL family acetyltransferase involved in cellulose biosynthesis